jgi:hypothetical protein
MDGQSVMGQTVDGRSVAAETDLGSLLPEDEVADLSQIKGLDKALQAMERALAQNVFHPKVGRESSPVEASHRPQGL